MEYGRYESENTTKIAYAYVNWRYVISGQYVWLWLPSFNASLIFLPIVLYKISFGDVHLYPGRSKSSHKSENYKIINAHMTQFMDVDIVDLE